MTEAIVLGGSRGIGKAIAASLQSIGIDVLAASSRDIDTSDLDSVRRFTQNHDSIDILVLNTGGPPPKAVSRTSPRRSGTSTTTSCSYHSASS